MVKGYLMGLRRWPMADVGPSEILQNRFPPEIIDYAPPPDAL